MCGSGTANAVPHGPAHGRRWTSAQPYLDLCAAERGGVDLQSAARRLGPAAGDVEAEASGAAAAAATPQRRAWVADPGARVRDEDEDGVRATVQRDRERGALGCVPEDVADQRVSDRR